MRKMQWQTQLSEKRKQIQTMFHAMAYMQLFLILNKNKLFLFKHPMALGSYQVAKIEAGENHQEALKRELIEELGFTAEIGAYYGQADEYFYSRHRDTYYYNPAYLYEATSFKEVQKPLEDFNHIAWFPY